MRRRGPSWENYEKVSDEAKNAKQELEQAQQQLADLQTLNKQMLTEMQVECADPVVPVSDAKFVNGLGKYMIPEVGTLTNHYRLVYDRSNELDFWPEQSPAFDGLVAQTFLDPAFARSNHPRYFDYEPLRDNVATVRNYVLQVVMNGVDVSNTAQMDTAMRKLEQMGREIGVGLQRDSLFRRPGSDHLDVTKSSIPGAGAADLYALLEKKQKKNVILHPLKALFGYDYKDWNLPPIEHTPFSKANVDDFCLGNFSQPENPSHLNEMQAVDATRKTQAEKREAEAQQQADAALAPQPAETTTTAPANTSTNTPEPAVAPQAQPQGLGASQQLAVLGATIAGTAFSLDRVKRLPSPVKARSVEIARDILDKMRMNVGNADQTAWLSRPAEEAVVQGEAISSLAALYGESYQAALVVDPNLKNDPQLIAGNAAIGKLAYLTKLQALQDLEAEGQTGEVELLTAEIAQYPESWKAMNGETIGDLLNQMQSGLELTHATVERAIAQHMQMKAELASQSPSQGPRPRAAAQEPQAPAAPVAAPVMEESDVAVAQQILASAPKMTPDQLQQLLHNSGLSPEKLDAVRQMQAQAAAMPKDIAQLGHAAQVGRNAPAESIAPQGNYRTAIQSQQRDGGEYLKR